MKSRTVAYLETFSTLFQANDGNIRQSWEGCESDAAKNAEYSLYLIGRLIDGHREQ